jgi:hypothetical protein
MSYAEALLSKELFELSDWEGEGEHFGHYTKDEWIETTPKYSLGYLLRKLPHKHNGGVLVIAACNTDEWCAQYFSWWHEDMKAKSEVLVADTPEDAACRLAIELFKQNILTRKDDL